MKKLKQFNATLLLVLVFSVPVFAGEIQLPGPQPPPSAPSAAVAAKDTVTPGIIHTPGAPIGSVTDATLNILQTLLSMF